MDWLSMLDTTLKQLQSPPSIPTWVLMLLCLVLLLVVASVFAAEVEQVERRVREEWRQTRLESMRVRGQWRGKDGWK